MFNSLTIRRAEPEDAAIIAYFSRRTFFESFAEQSTKKDMAKFLTLQFSVRSLMSEVNRKHNIILLAHRFHTLVGYALLREAKNPPEIHSAVKGIELARLYVDIPFKGTGVGEALMKECVSLARLQYKEVLWSGVWCKDTETTDFYQQWGFKRCGSKIFLLGDNPQLHWIMKKDLQF